MKSIRRSVIAAFLVLAFALGQGAGAQTNQTYQNNLGITPFVCRVTAVTATTECRAAPAAGLKAYITDAAISNNVGTAQTVKLVTGTGANCATSTADLTHAVQFGAAVGNWNHSWQTPPPPPAASAICVTPSAVTSISATLTGFIGP